MNPDQQAQNSQPTSMTGSNWQRQALTNARAKAAAAKHSDASSPTIEAARQRATAQQVPDMLAPLDPAQTQPTEPEQTQAAQPATQAPPSGEASGKPVVSGALAPDEPVAGAPVVGTGGPSTGKKIAVALLMFFVIAGAAAVGFLLFV